MDEGTLRAHTLLFDQESKEKIVRGKILGSGGKTKRGKVCLLDDKKKRKKT